MNIRRLWYLGDCFYRAASALIPAFSIHPVDLARTIVHVIVLVNLETKFRNKLAGTLLKNISRGTVDGFAQL